MIISNSKQNILSKIFNFLLKSQTLNQSVNLKILLDFSIKITNFALQNFLVKNTKAKQFIFRYLSVICADFEFFSAEKSTKKSNKDKLSKIDYSNKKYQLSIV